MELIFAALGGAIGGILYEKIKGIHYETCGYIDVDHNNGMCKVRITSDELDNRKVKKAVFKINHDAIISREEQML